MALPQAAAALLLLMASAGAHSAPPHGPIGTAVQPGGASDALFTATSGRERIAVTLDGVYERDAAGQTVGAPGHLHAADSLTKQFKVDDGDEDRRVAAANTPASTVVVGAQLAMEATVPGVGELRVETAVLAAAQMAGPGGDEWQAAAGDLAWSIQLSAWSWCGCADGNRTVVGSYIDVMVSVSGTVRHPSLANATDGLTVFLGAGVSMQLSNKVVVDGAETAMPSGYPHVHIRGSVLVFALRFPRFHESASYEPLLRMNATHAANATNATNAPNATEVESTTGTAGAAEARTTTTRTTTILHSEELTAGNVSLKVRGRGGRFIAYAVDHNDPHRVAVSMDALREVDCRGRAVGTTTMGGAVKHSVPSFAMQDFTFGRLEHVTAGQARAQRLSFKAPAGKIGQTKVQTFLVTKAGMTGPEGDMWYASTGDVKWSVEVSRWSWCGCTQGGVEQQGSFVDLDMFLDGSYDRPVKVDVGEHSWDLGGGVIVELTNKIEVDGKVVDMPEHFPRMELRGPDVVFVVRFPKFERSATYESLLRMSASETIANASAAAPGGTHHPAFVSGGRRLAGGRAAWVWGCAALLAAALSPAGRA